MTPDDAMSWKDLATAGATVISGAVLFVVNAFTRRLDAHERNDTETFNRIADWQNTLSQQVSEGFRGLDENINKTHIKLLERISDIQQHKP